MSLTCLALCRVLNFARVLALQSLALLNFAVLKLCCTAKKAAVPSFFAG